MRPKFARLFLCHVKTGPSHDWSWASVMVRVRVRVSHLGLLFPTGRFDVTATSFLRDDQGRVNVRGPMAYNSYAFIVLSPLGGNVFNKCFLTDRKTDRQTDRQIILLLQILYLYAS